jgi:hypothetical protein
MSERKAVVLDGGKLKEMPAGDEVEAHARLIDLEKNFRKLLQAFVLSGQPIPPSLENEFMRSLGE